MNELLKIVRRLQVNAFIVRKGSKGLRTSKIENKIALRCVQNADIFLDDCFVPNSARLPGVNSFKVLTRLHMGITLIWLARVCFIAHDTRSCTVMACSKEAIAQVLSPWFQSLPYHLIQWQHLGTAAEGLTWRTGHEQGAGNLAHHGGLAARGHLLRRV